MNELKPLTEDAVYELLTGSKNIACCVPVHSDGWGNPSEKEKVNGFLSGFHMVRGALFEELDDYNFGMRADHFAVEIGYSEFAYVLPGCEHPNDHYDYDWFIVVFANHKGTRCVSVYRLSPDVSRTLNVLLG